MRFGALCRRNASDSLTALLGVSPDGDDETRTRERAAASVLERLDGSDVDRARIRRALETARGDSKLHVELVETLIAEGSGAFVHPSGQRNLPGRRARHDLGARAVALGRIADAVPVAVDKNPAELLGRPFGLDLDLLRTSLLVIGPPGSGKTRSFAEPIIEHLALEALAREASLVVLDPKGDDFAFDGWFDYTIDIGNPHASCGFSLFGGADSPAEAADRLASALIPAATPETAYFTDSAKNALYNALAPYLAAHDGRWPTLRALLDLLTSPGGSTWQSVRDRLRNKGRLKEFELELSARERQTSRRDDPAASLAERLGLLNRPHLVQLFDVQEPRFGMRQIDTPVRVRIALPEEQSPDAVRILARLAISQFAQVASSPKANRSIFKGLVCDEAGRYIDDYVVGAVRKIRSNNAGMVLLTQSLADIPADLCDSLFTSTGGKAVFAGANPRDAESLSAYWGTRFAPEITHHAGVQEGRSLTTRGIIPLPGDITRGRQRSVSHSTSIRQEERLLWSAGEVINAIPARHCVVTLTSSDGRRSPPMLVEVEPT
jgi:hypothetical protein